MPERDTRRNKPCIPWIWAGGWEFWLHCVGPRSGRYRCARVRARITPVGGEADGGARWTARRQWPHAAGAWQGRHEGGGGNGGKGKLVRHSCKATSKVQHHQGDRHDERWRAASEHNKPRRNRNEEEEDGKIYKKLEKKGEDHGTARSHTIPGDQTRRAKSAATIQFPAARGSAGTHKPSPKATVRQTKQGN